MKPKVRTSVRLEPEIVEKIRALAKEQGRTFSGMVNYLLRQCVKK